MTALTAGLQLTGVRGRSMDQVEGAGNQLAPADTAKARLWCLRMSSGILKGLKMSDLEWVYLICTSGIVSIVLFVLYGIREGIKYEEQKHRDYINALARGPSLVAGRPKLRIVRGRDE